MNRKKIFIIFLTVVMFTLPFAGITALADSYDSYSIYVDGKKISETGFYTKGNVYLPVSMIGTYCKNNGVSLDEKNKQLLIDISKENIMLADDTVTDFVKANAGTIIIPLKTLNSELCFSINAMSQFFKLDYSLSGKSIKLRELTGKETVARVCIDEAVAVPSLDSASDERLTLKKGQRVYIEGTTDNYSIISDYDGNLYYVLSGSIATEDIDLSSVDFYAAKKTKFVQKANDRINLVWQYVSEVTPQAPEAISGIDILAPTWFRLKVNDGGNVTNSGDRGYSDLAHSAGYMVWATITNNMSASGSTKFTTAMFADSSIENRAVAQYILYSCIYDADGINIDFEDVTDADRDGLTAFTKKMRRYTERQGLNLSIDTLVPASWTVEYDRKTLSNYVDYLAVMTYDEHYSGSKTAGSIASLPWVEKAVKGCIDEGVPSRKLLMGIPLYTRIWIVDGSGNIVSKSSATMSTVQNTLRINNAVTTYLDKEKQNYAEYATSTGTAKIWIEDSTSIKNRLELAKSYNLAGTACWQFSQASSDIWSLFE